MDNRMPVELTPFVTEDGYEHVHDLRRFLGVELATTLLAEMMTRYTKTFWPWAESPGGGT